MQQLTVLLHMAAQAITGCYWTIKLLACTSFRVQVFQPGMHMQAPNNQQQ